MADVLTTEQRRLNMSRIRGKNTKPEMLLRKALYSKGLRFRIHRNDLPGAPDIVFASQKIAVFVDGCFWHGCPDHAVEPKTNRLFWRDKIDKNKKRDDRATDELRALGWKVIRIWEHDIKQSISHAARASSLKRESEGIPGLCDL
ncbi:MAG: very short patch repair endonuclease [Rhizomicrobium sp.]